MATKFVCYENDQLERWVAWCEGVWRSAERKWIDRTGQDHFYRTAVVVPALAEEILKKGPFNTLVDVGCGDGFTTERVLAVLDSTAAEPATICLVDQSEKQLTAALTRPHLSNARRLVANIEYENWTSVFRDPLGRPAVVISTFVLQELPSLSPLLKALAKFMASDDLALLLMVDPAHSAALLESGAIKLIARSDGESFDWEWAGKFPISLDHDVIYLPHFQRDVEAIQAESAVHGLSMISAKRLAVPDTEEARRVFSETVYGEEIIGRPSSVLFSLTKMPEWRL